MDEYNSFFMRVLLLLPRNDENCVWTTTTQEVVDEGWVFDDENAKVMAGVSDLREKEKKKKPIAVDTFWHVLLVNENTCQD